MFNRKKWSKQYYLTHREQFRATSLRTQHRRLAENKLILRLFKETEPCADCGKIFPHWVMQFDHARGPRKYFMSVACGRGIDELKKEAAKCDLLCANCHRTRTYKRRQEGYE